MRVGGQPLLRRVRNNRIKKKLCSLFSQEWLGGGGGGGGRGGRLRQVYFILAALQKELKAAVSTRKLGQSGIAACTRVFSEGAPSAADSQR